MKMKTPPLFQTDDDFLRSCNIVPEPIKPGRTRYRKPNPTPAAATNPYKYVDSRGEQLNELHAKWLRAIEADDQERAKAIQKEIRRVQGR